MEARLPASYAAAVATPAQTRPTGVNIATGSEHVVSKDERSQKDRGSFNRPVHEKGTNDEPTEGTSETLAEGRLRTTEVDPNYPEAKDNTELCEAGKEAAQDETSQGFQRPKQHMRNEKKRETRTIKTVFGKKNHPSLSGNPRSRDLFLFNCKPHATCDIVKAFLAENTVDILEIECTSHTEARGKSFRIKIKVMDMDKIMSTDFLPEGVGCRQWKKKRNIGDFSQENGGRQF